MGMWGWAVCVVGWVGAVVRLGSRVAGVLEHAGRRPLCRSCGYDRTGLGGEASCPECGALPGRAGPEWVAPMPSRGVLLRRLLWPSALLPVAAGVWLVAGPPGGLVALLCVLLGLGVPVWVAGSVAFECTPQSRREWVFIRLLALGWGVNLLVLGVLVVALLL